MEKTMSRTLTVFLICCAFYIVTAEGADDVIEWLKRGIHERAKSDEVEQKSLDVLKTAWQCFVNLRRDQPPLIKKMLTNVLFQGTECASTKLGIEDSMERQEAEKLCYLNAAKSRKDLGDLTDEEVTLYDAVGDNEMEGLKTSPSIGLRHDEVACSGVLNKYRRSKQPNG